MGHELVKNGHQVASMITKNDANFALRKVPIELPSHCKESRGFLVVRASDSRPEGLGSMPDATKHPPSTHGCLTSLEQYNSKLYIQVQHLTLLSCSEDTSFVSLSPSMELSHVPLPVTWSPFIWSVDQPLHDTMINSFENIRLGLQCEENTPEENFDTLQECEEYYETKHFFK
ncbi:hypothetical protein TNCV_4831671 [Trichonephila clavipes]|nr:hypothetical protein TNCV_4831671 [Trichonephila clavipes]